MLAAMKIEKVHPECIDEGVDVLLFIEAPAKRDFIL
jgi:hypothetical protein